MTKQEIKEEAIKVQDLIKSFETIVPKDYEEYNALRLQYDTANTRLQSLHMQLDALLLIEQLKAIPE